MRLSKLPKILPGMHAEVPAEAANCRVAGVAHDSRRVKPGWVFVAICGCRRNGASFAEDAVARGAVAVVAEERLQVSRPVLQFVVDDARRALAALANAFYGRPSRTLQVVGVTGTNGKTTTTHMYQAIVQAAGKGCGVLGTIAYDTGRRRLPASITTPESVDVQCFLREMCSAGLEHAALEVSSHGLSMRRVDFVQFTAGVFTNLTEEHMDYHGTFAAYRRAKARLFRGLGPANWAILNADDPNSERMVKECCAKRMWYGLKRTAEVTARVESSSLDGLRIGLRTPAGATEMMVPLIGRHNVYNAMAAAAAALSQGFTLDDIRAGIEGMLPVPGRLEQVPCEKECRVLVDFAHTDHALTTVLDSLRKLCGKRILVVFGAGGDRDRTKRPRMGRAVEKGADLAWVTSDNPRSEEPQKIIDEILSGVHNRSRMQIQPDRRRAIEEAMAAAEAGDLVLIAGKGHERTQRFRDTVIPFDDREAVRAALASRATAAPAALAGV